MRRYERPRLDTAGLNHLRGARSDRGHRRKGIARRGEEVGDRIAGLLAGRDLLQPAQNFIVEGCRTVFQTGRDSRLFDGVDNHRFPRFYCIISSRK